MLSEARRRFARLLVDPSDVATLPSEYKVPVFKIVISSGGAEEFEQFMKICRESTSTVEKKQVSGVRIVKIGGSVKGFLLRRAVPSLLERERLACPRCMLVTAPHQRALNGDFSYED